MVTKLPLGLSQNCGGYDEKVQRNLGEGVTSTMCGYEIISLKSSTFAKHC